MYYHYVVEIIFPVQQTQSMRQISIENRKLFLEDDIEAIIEGEVKKIGNGGMVLSAKKYIGRKVYILIRK